MALLQDVRYSLRLLRRTPGFTIAAIAAAALGIGTNTAIFSVVNTVLLKPLTYPDSGRIVQFLVTSPDGAGTAVSVTKFNLWRQLTGVFESVSAYNDVGPVQNLTGGDNAVQVKSIHVTADFFKLFGARVIQGRTFTAEEDRPNAGHFAVLSYGLWQRRFGGDAGIVGKAIQLGGDPHEVVGIIGPDFVADPPADVWLPFQFDPNSTDQAHYFLAAGRLKPIPTASDSAAPCESIPPSPDARVQRVCSDGTAPLQPGSVWTARRRWSRSCSCNGCPLTRRPSIASRPWSTRRSLIDEIRGGTALYLSAGKAPSTLSGRRSESGWRHKPGRRELSRLRREDRVSTCGAVRLPLVSPIVGSEQFHLQPGCPHTVFTAPVVPDLAGTGRQIANFRDERKFDTEGVHYSPDFRELERLDDCLDLDHGVECSVPSVAGLA